MNGRGRRVYLSSVYSERQLMAEWRDQLNLNGISVVSSWIDGDKGILMAGLCEGCPEMSQAEVDLADLLLATTLVARCDPALRPLTAGGRHVEMGAAIAWNKEIIIVGQPENIFHLMHGIYVVPTIDKAIALLKAREVL